MRSAVRKLFVPCAALLSLAASLTPVLQAQDDGPPKVLVIHREYLKPGKGGALHDRSESAFVQAFADAKSAYYYFALDSLSGPSRSLFLSSYDSFADWEKEADAIRGNAALAAKIDQASLNDGDLLSGYDATALALRPDLSLNKGSLKGTRYFEITVFVVKPGHSHDFEELAKTYVDAFRKIDPAAHWDTFEVVYGNPAPTVPGGDIFMVATTVKSLGETDKSMQNGEKFAAQLGAAALKKVGELTAASVASENTSLFVINPRMSNPRPEWITGDPAFWKAK
jgi:hypothetical protein